MGEDRFVGEAKTGVWFTVSSLCSRLTRFVGRGEGAYVSSSSSKFVDLGCLIFRAETLLRFVGARDWRAIVAMGERRRNVVYSKG